MEILRPESKSVPNQPLRKCTPSLLWSEFSASCFEDFWLKGAAQMDHRCSVLVSDGEKRPPGSYSSSLRFWSSFLFLPHVPQKGKLEEEGRGPGASTQNSSACFSIRAPRLTRRRMLWLWTVLLGPLAESPAEGKSPMEVTGILRGSATFLLESPRPFDRVFWFKDDIQVAFLRVGAPCEVYCLAAFAGREVTASQDCRSVTIGGLLKEDSARYRARIRILDSERPHEVETFDLKVYRNSAESKAPQEVMGILGESATFTLESPQPFELVFWYGEGTGLATLRAEPPPCQFTLAKPYPSQDVTVSQDCRSLTVRGLRKEDSAGYRALTLNKDEVVADQTFILKVYKCLSEADLEVVCAPEIRKDGNQSLQLNCSVGKWEDGVEFSWTSPTKTGVIAFLEKSPVLRYKPQDDDRNLTCTAQNPVGSTSRTVSLKQACATGTMDSSSLLSSEAALGVTIATMVVAKVIITACFLAMWLSCTKKGELQGAGPCFA